MDKLKTGIMIMLVAIAIIGITVSSVIAEGSASCTRTSGKICVSCTYTSFGVTLTGYNYRDDVLPNTVFNTKGNTYFNTVAKAQTYLKNKGYSRTCAAGTLNPRDQLDHTKSLGGSCNWDRYQTQIDSSGKYLRFSQGPEPNPCYNLLCGRGGSILAWHIHCFDDCSNRRYCSAGSGID